MICPHIIVPVPTLNDLPIIAPVVVIELLPFPIFNEEPVIDPVVKIAPLEFIDHIIVDELQLPKLFAAS